MTQQPLTPSPTPEELVRAAGGDTETFRGRLIADLVRTSLKMVRDRHDTGQLKLINSAMKEMRDEFVAAQAE